MSIDARVTDEKATNAATGAARGRAARSVGAATTAVWAIAEAVWIDGETRELTRKAEAAPRECLPRVS